MLVCSAGVYLFLTMIISKLNYFRNKFLNICPQVTLCKKKVLVVPLDWGLGHATRDIPLIRELLNAGCVVVIAAEGKHAALLSREFPEITILPSPVIISHTAKRPLFRR